MNDMGSMDGSVEAVGGGGGGGGNSSGGGTGNGGSTGGSFGGNDSGNNASVSASLDFGNMNFTTADAATLGAIAVGAAFGYGGISGAAGAVLGAAGVAAGLSGSPVGTAFGDLGHDMSQGLGTAISANPIFNMFNATSVSVADFNSSDGGTPYATNLGGGYIAEFTASGSLIDVMCDPVWLAASNGSGGGG